MTVDTMLEKDKEYILGTYGRFPVAIDHGEGAKVYTKDNKEYIDMTSGIGVNCLGHNNKVLTDALEAQLHKIIHACNLYYTEPMINVAEELVKSTKMSKVFFANSGAEANEGMIKTARKYSFDKYGEGRDTVITLKQSFHGRTVMTLEATGQDKFHQYFFPFTGGFKYVKAGDMEELKNTADEHTCAVMMEMIQGEGGVIPLDKEYVKEVEAFCNENDLLLLIDEVQTGIGRTGTLFAYEQFDIKPDIVSMAKGLGGGVPIGGFIVSDKLDGVMNAGSHGSTFGGNPLSAAAAKAVLSVVNKPEFLEEVKNKGDYIKTKVLSFGSDNIKSVRGMGLMVGIIVDPYKRGDFVSKLMDKGVLVLTAGKDAIRLLPPLVITYEEIDKVLDVIKEIL